MKEKVLIADDEKELADVTGAILAHNDYDVEVVYNGRDALVKVKENVYDVIILDVMMPVLNGIDTVKEIRKLNVKTPIILLTAKSEVEDKVEGLDAGANDYLTKPFFKAELLARIRALTRQKEKSKYKLENITFDKENSKIFTEVTSLHLNNKECEVMELLIKNQERAISPEELKKRVWTNENNYDNIVPMYISYLQDKLSALNADVKIMKLDGEYCLSKGVKRDGGF